MRDELAVELARELGSPLYAYDLDVVEARVHELLALLPAGSRLYFSLKANPLPSIGEVLCAAGCGAEVSSPGELAAALEADFPPQRLLYTGPGKGSDELRAALSAGAVWFSCESFAELGRLVEQGEASGIRPRVLLRINPRQPPAAALAMAGVPSQFGFEEDELVARAWEVLAAAERLDLVGVHVFFGTQVTDARALLANAEGALAAAARVEKALGRTLPVLDLGGGFPWPFAVEGSGPDMVSLRAGLRAAGQGRAAAVELWFESGRYLCAAAGGLLTRVVDVKRSKLGRKYVVVDAGINHLAGMAGLGRVLRPRVSARIVGKAAAASAELCDLVGPLCSPLDTLACGIPLGDPAPGDLLHIPNVGAYGLTASLVHFLSRDPPLEVSYRRERCTGIHRLRRGHERQPLPDRLREWKTPIAPA